MRGFDCKCRFIKRKGFLSSCRSLNGIAASLWSCCIFIIMFLLSNMLWKIDITGANPETEHQIRQQLDQIGVKKAAFSFQC
ncbi:sporulation protein YqfD [Bacillus licheniformis]|nr:sporulation protein YqfD [Bacillus licheniformis]